jgi:hypothetical protein
MQADIARKIGEGWRQATDTGKRQKLAGLVSGPDTDASKRQPDMN